MNRGESCPTHAPRSAARARRSRRYAAWPSPPRQGCPVGVVSLLTKRRVAAVLSPTSSSTGHGTSIALGLGVMTFRVSWSPAFLLAITSVLLGCDPHASMSGTVRRQNGSPVPGAKVTITCSSLDGGRMTATTNTQGAFSASRIGCIDKQCGIDVSVTGEPTRRFATAEYCAADCGDSCPSAIKADLTIPD
jgi:hypothetical protein